MVEPKVSIVVPTRNRRELLGRLLRALESQTIGVCSFEVIVVDDASEVPLQETNEFRLDVRVLRQDVPGGPGAARNRGWRVARAPLIAFIDDDCRPCEAWLDVMLDTCMGADDLIVQGRTEPEPAQRASRWPLSHTMDISGANGLYETCNIAYARPLLERTGGFDERLRRAGEDVDLGTRASGLGGRLIFAPQALVYHVVTQPTLTEMIRHAHKWSDAVLALKLNPELRALLVANVFWKRTHPLLMLAAGGLALSLGRRSAIPAVFAALPYIDHYWRVYASSGQSWARGLRSLPTHVVVDAVEIATAVEGSVRHRTIML